MANDATCFQVDEGPIYRLRVEETAAFGLLPTIQEIAGR
jgi:hypothetical protein